MLLVPETERAFLKKVVIEMQRNLTVQGFFCEFKSFYSSCMLLLLYAVLSVHVPTFL